MSHTTTCDTSVLVPALLPWHPHHEPARRAVLDSVSVIPAHVVLELYSVLTRLPSPHRLAAEAAAATVEALGRDVCTLPAEHHASLIAGVAAAGVRGGAVYDALIGATAAHHQLLLLTRDRRARPTYDVVGTRYSLV